MCIGLGPELGKIDQFAPNEDPFGKFTHLAFAYQLCPIMPQGFEMILRLDILI